MERNHNLLVLNCGWSKTCCTWPECDFARLVCLLDAWPLPPDSGQLSKRQRSAAVYSTQLHHSKQPLGMMGERKITINTVWRLVLWLASIERKHFKEIDQLNHLLTLTSFPNLHDFLSTVEHKKKWFTTVFVHTLKVSGVQTTTLEPTNFNCRHKIFFTI